MEFETNRYSVPARAGHSYDCFLLALAEQEVAQALLDRLTHRAHILESVGESYRFRQRMQREAEEKSNV